MHQTPDLNIIIKLFTLTRICLNYVNYQHFKTSSLTTVKSIKDRRGYYESSFLTMELVWQAVPWQPLVDGTSLTASTSSSNDQSKVRLYPTSAEAWKLADSRAKTACVCRRRRGVAPLGTQDGTSDVMTASCSCAGTGNCTVTLRRVWTVETWLAASTSEKRARREIEYLVPTTSFEMSSSPNGTLSFC